MICSSAFWKQKCENLKMLALLSFHPFQPSDRQFYCTGVIIYTKLDNYINFVSVDRQTFLGFEMISNSDDGSP